MFADLDWKLVAAGASAAIGIISFFPYVWQIFKGETQPHAYTWLVWAITQLTVAAGVWHGGGGIISYALVLYALCAFIVFLLSFKYGTKNITRGDTIVFIGALVAILIWWQLDNPVLAVLVATGIDLAGYWPTFRKSFYEPWTENVLAWIGYVISPALTLFALMEYNLLTTTYATATLIANAALVALLLIRRRAIRKTP